MLQAYSLWMNAFLATSIVLLRRRKTTLINAALGGFREKTAHLIGLIGLHILIRAILSLRTGEKDWDRFFVVGLAVL